MLAALYTFSYLGRKCRLTERFGKLRKVPKTWSPSLVDANMHVPCSCGAGETPRGVLKREPPALVRGSLRGHVDKVSSGTGLEEGGHPTRLQNGNGKVKGEELGGLATAQRHPKVRVVNGVWRPCTETLSQEEGAERAVTGTE